MSIYVKALFASSLVIGLTGCLGGPAFMKKGNGNVNNDDDDDDSGQAEVEKDEEGVLTAKISANATTAQTISASANSEISSASVTFPPGALTIDTSVTIEQGANVVSDSVAAEIGLAGVSVAPAGAAVVLSSLIPTDAAQPFTVAIPLSSAQLALAEKGFLIVICKVYKAAEGKTFVGIRPTSHLTVKDGKVFFETQHFGVFQAGYSDKEILEEKQAETTAPILTKAKEKTLEAVAWQGVTVSFDAATGKLTVQGSATGIGPLSQCIAFADRDKTAPYDFSASLGAALGSTVGFGNVSDGTFHVRVDCTEATGRVSQSAWSEQVFEYKKATPVPSDTTGPSIVTRNPGPDVTGIARNASVSFEFDEPIDPTSLQGGCFSLKAPAGAPVPFNAAPTLSNSNKAVTFTPATQLAMSARYKVEIAANCIKDAAGNGAAASTWSFTTQDGVWSLASDFNGTPMGGTSTTGQGAINAAGDQVLTFKASGLVKIATRKLPSTTWSINSVGIGSVDGGVSVLDVKTALYDNGAATTTALVSDGNFVRVSVNNRQPGQDWMNPTDPVPANRPIILNEADDDSDYSKHPHVETSFDGNHLMAVTVLDNELPRVIEFGGPTTGINQISGSNTLLGYYGKVRLLCNKQRDCIVG